MGKLFYIVLIFILLPDRVRSQDSSSVLYVYVYDVKTKKPLDHVYIQLYNKTNEIKPIDSAGCYVFSNIPPGYYTLSAARYEYESSKTEQVIGAGSKRVHTIYLKPVDRSKNIFTDPFKRPTYNSDFDRFEFYGLRFTVNAGFYLTGELGIARSSLYKKDMGWLDLGPHQRSSYSISCEYIFKKENPVIIPKISFDYANFLCYGLSTMYATDRNVSTFYIQPRIGKTIGAVFDISYGYTIPISKNDMKGKVNTHILTLTFYTEY